MRLFTGTDEHAEVVELRARVARLEQRLTEREPRPAPAADRPFISPPRRSVDPTEVEHRVAAYKAGSLAVPGVPAAGSTAEAARTEYFVQREALRALIRPGATGVLERALVGWTRDGLAASLCAALDAQLQGWGQWRPGKRIERRPTDGAQFVLEPDYRGAR